MPASTVSGKLADFRPVVLDTIQVRHANDGHDFASMTVVLQRFGQELVPAQFSTAGSSA